MNLLPTPLSAELRAWIVFGIVTSLSLFGFYYGSGWLKGEDTSLLILYRPGVGDRDYLPLARQFGEGNFTEAYTSGLLGRVSIAFPCASLLPHGLALRWLGPPGFAIADILTPAAYFLVATRLLLFAGAAPRIAIVLSLFFTMQGFAVLSQAIISVFGFALRGVPFFLDFIQCWEFRFPRKFVSEIYVLGALGNWCALARFGLDRSIVWWLTTAALMAAVLQSDVYSFIALAFAFGAVGVVRWTHDRQPHPRVLFSRLTLLVLLGLALSIPFLLQRSAAHPDVLERYGVFPVARSRAFQLAHIAWHYFPLSYTWTILALPLTVCLALRRAGFRELFPKKFAVSLTLLPLAGFAALPVLIASSAQGVQLYHFRDATRTLLAWSTLMVAALALTAVATWLRANWTRARSLSPIASFSAVALMMAFCWPAFQHAQDCLGNSGAPRAIYPRPASPPITDTYRNDFAALTVELDRAFSQGARILATTDVELYAWWTGLRGRKSFLAHIFVSGLDRRILFERIALFARYNQLAPADFIPWLLTGQYDTLHVSWFSGNIYQATSLHTYAKISDYTDNENAQIAATSPLDCWKLIIPEAERQRLIADYRTVLDSPSEVAEPPPDLIVVLNETPQLRPDPRRFSLIHENATFALFRLR